MPQRSANKSWPSCPGDDEWMKGVGGGLDLGISQGSWCWHQGPEDCYEEEPSIVRRIGWSSSQGLLCTSRRLGQTLYGSERQNKSTGNSLVQVTCSVMSNSLQPHGLKHARLPCPSPTPECTLTHVHWVSGAIQPSHPLSSPSPPALNLSQNQGLFQGVSSLHQVAKVLEFHLQHQSFQWIFRTDFLEDGLVRSTCSPRNS